jgi:LysR family hydrogen peroxide-inducible transcriptional activator
MNLRVFEYLLALEKHGSFHKAAEACNVSQPALSIQIKKTETELDIQLLERGHKAFIITPVGQEILTRARSIIQQVDEIEELAEIWHDPYSGSFSLGAFPTLAPYYFPRIIDHFVESYPSLQINLVEEKTAVLVERLKTGQLDAAFLALPIKEEGLESGIIFSEEFLLGVSSSHPLAKRKGQLKNNYQHLLVYLT